MASVDPQVASPAYALRWAQWVDKRRRPIVLIAAALALVSAFLALLWRDATRERARFFARTLVLLVGGAFAAGWLMALIPRN